MISLNKFFRFFLLLMLSTALSCSDDSGDDPNPSGSDELFLYHSRTNTSDGSVNFFTPLSSIEPNTTLDLSQSLEFGGAPRMFSIPDTEAFIINDFDAAQMTRYTLGENDEFVPGLSLSFSNFGITFISPLNTNIISSTKAYTLQGPTFIIWNPETMEIISNATIDALVPPEGFSGFSWFGKVVDNNLYLPWTNRLLDDFTVLRDVVTVVKINISTDQVTVIEDNSGRGGKSDLISIGSDENGNVYAFSGNVANWSANINNADNNGDFVMRILSGQDEFDPTYFERISENVGGGRIQVVNQIGNGDLVVQYLDESIAWEENFGSDQWRLGIVSFPDLNQIEIVGNPFALNNAIFPIVDGRTLVDTPDGEYASSVLIDITNGQPDVVFSSPNTIGISLIRVR